MSIVYGFTRNSATQTRENDRTLAMEEFYAVPFFRERGESQNEIGGRTQFAPLNHKKSWF